LGTGQLAPFLEERLMGLSEGAEQTFILTPEQSFGFHNPELLQRVSRTTLRKNSQLGEEYRVGDVVEFAAPGGGRFAGVLLEVNEDDALFDFNHPLAGQTLRFDVRIIGIL
jgi:FKBP-type peptidyl-prolyl cis-trans isomerase SlpA